MRETYDEQAAVWNGAGGRAWVDAQELLDRMYKPLEDLLMAAVTASAAREVLDVGCGTGATVLAVARQLGANGTCTGVDVSEPMIAVARARVERAHLHARFICTDAQRHAFDPDAFDLVISRFGVMFFDDPVAAFSNLRRAGRQGAGLRLIAWRSAADNPFMTTAERAAAPLLPMLAARKQGGPGQFAFADPAWVRSVLEKSGWADVDIQPIDVVCAFPKAGLRSYLTRLGPVGRALDGADEETRARVLETVIPAFDSYVQDEEVRFTAACWMISGRAGAFLPQRPNQ
jgi:SAM-dependent methyltransferase